MGATLVCSHILAGTPPLGDVTLRGEGPAWNYVRLCGECTRLSRVPGGLIVMLPKAPAAVKPRTLTALDDYIANRPTKGDTP